MNCCVICVDLCVFWRKMWYAAVIRILRRRVVLTIIFLLSLTYCLVNLFGHVNEMEILFVFFLAIFISKLLNSCPMFVYISFCRVEIVRRTMRKLCTNVSSRWFGKMKWFPMARTPGVVQMVVGIQYRAKYCWSMMRAMFVLEIKCWAMDAVMPMVEWFNTTVIRVIVRMDAVQSMNDVLAAAWIQTR